MPNEAKMPVYVVDTNVLIDYPNIIPNGADSIPDSPTVDTSSAHIVVPTAVIRELSNFKGEKSDRGKAARVILKRIRTMVEGQNLKLADVYALKAPITIKNSDGLFSVLPVAKDFAKDLPFSPGTKDMDGQIILAALSAQEKADGAEVVLLTNDNGLAIRATGRGVKTNRYGYKPLAPYTGRRELKVPFDLYHRWAADKKRISLALWKEMMPEQPELVANEFVIMTPADWQEHIPCFDNIGRYDAKEEAIVGLKYATQFPGMLKHPGHACYAEALYHPDIKMVIASGVAGTGKTFMATVYSLESCKNGEYIGVVAVIRTEEDDGVGYLPGDLDEKLDPNAQPIKGALKNWFIQTDKSIKQAMTKAAAKRRGSKSAGTDEEGEEKPESKSVAKRIADKVNLTWKNWFENVAVTHVKGRDFAYQVVIVDEMQDLTNDRGDTVIKRIGHEGKMILTGDLAQIHSPYLDEYSNGLSYAIREMTGDEETAQILLLPHEVMRDPIVMRLTKRQQAARDAARHSHQE
jgi:PhoH-like ATPase